jgi:hypothetical protein
MNIHLFDFRRLKTPTKGAYAGMETTSFSAMVMSGGEPVYVSGLRLQEGRMKPPIITYAFGKRHSVVVRLSRAICAAIAEQLFSLADAGVLEYDTPLVSDAQDFISACVIDPITVRRAAEQYIEQQKKVGL